MIRHEILPMYCYHCGKKLTLEEKERTQKMQGNIHTICLRERRKMIGILKKERWMKLMSDPKIKKLIYETDKKVLKEHGIEI